MTGPIGFHEQTDTETEEDVPDAHWWQGRKFLLAVLCLVPGAALAAFGKLTGEYVTLASVVMTAFSTADTLITRKSLASS